MKNNFSEQSSVAAGSETCGHEHHVQTTTAAAATATTTTILFYSPGHQLFLEKNMFLLREVSLL